MAVDLFEHLVHFFGAEADQREGAAGNAHRRGFGEAGAGEDHRRGGSTPTNQFEEARVVQQAAHHRMVEETAVGGQEEHLALPVGQVEVAGGRREERVGVYCYFDAEDVE